MLRVLLFIACFSSRMNFYAQDTDPKVEWDGAMEIGLSTLHFFTAGLYIKQKSFYPSISIRPKASMYWTSNNGSITFEGFARYDAIGGSRTHWDIRELYYQYYGDRWELNLGLKRLFWGKLETVHLVDVINQIDFLEGFDGEEKLGQAMIQAIYSSNAGDFSLFLLPYSRQIAFGNEASRPRTPEVITAEQVSFESESEEWHPTLSFRWSHYIGESDIGIHYFYGNAREPNIVFDNSGTFGLRYPVVHQIGIDYQVILSSTTFKLESVYRSGEFQNISNIFSIAGGLEHTLVNANETGTDIGLIAEYVYDNRREFSFNSLDNDLFLGSRISFNNESSTEIILGIYKDLSKSTALARLKGSHRLRGNMKLSFLAQFYSSVDPQEFVHFFRRDSSLEIELLKYF